MGEANGTSIELYRTHRPKTFKSVVGQDEAVRTLTDFLKRKAVPHTLLFVGASGCGKTTLARILRHKLQCSDMDFNEVNCASNGSIDMVRQIDQQMRMAPMSGPCRVWLLDEFQSLSRAGFAQQSMLAMLEDTPDHVYFILCTTDPTKIIKAIQTRCTRINVQPLTPTVLTELVQSVAEKESVELSDDLISKIVECAEGSARQALVLLHKVIGLENDEERLSAITPNQTQQQVFDLVKMLLWEKPPTWSKVAQFLSTVVVDDVERFRHLVLTCANKELLKGGKGSARAAAVINTFSYNWFDCPETGLAMACWAVLGGK